MSAEVLDKPNEASKKNEEALVEFKRDSTLEQFLLQKSGNKEKAFTFKQVPLLQELLMNIIFPLSDSYCIKKCYTI